MTFTDDDLKRLKARAERPHGMPMGPWYDDDIKALLARLEAAEECAAYLEAMEKGDNKGSQALMILDAWRKAAGK